MKKLNLACIALMVLGLFLVSCNEEVSVQDEMDQIVENASPKRVCNSADYLNKQLMENPGMQENLEKIERQIAEFSASEISRSSSSVYTIPVVVHVVYKSNTQNISDAQVLSQIDVLNKDFRRLNTDANNTWSQADDTQIEFCLASVDPNGNPTSGITRTQTNVTSFNPDQEKMKKSGQGGIDPWNPSEYLNIWVCNISQGILGYAQFPGGPAATDGVVVGYQYFGTSGTATAPFNLGRTGTHEVGHYLNLYHIWGDGPCGQDDNVSDTPASDAANYGCASGHSSCGSTDMVENYMDYSDDACMNLFTTGQKNRMRALLAQGGARAGLVSSNACGGSGGGGGTTPTCSDGIQNGNETGVDCGGSCPPCSTPPTCTDGVQNGDETGVDCGGASCPPCNTGATEVIKIIVQTDIYGSETTWELKNSAGTVVATGGPYPDGVVKRRQKKVTVNSDDCYEFTIYDSYGDGFCCEYGFGKFWIRKANHQIIKSGNGNFSTSRTKTFCLSPNSNREDLDIIEPKLESSLSATTVDASGQLTVDIQNPPRNTQLSILDANGNVVKSLPVGRNSETRKVDVRSLPKGQYTLVMGKEGKQKTEVFNIE